MTALLPIDRVLADRRLLGAALDMSTRQTWLTVWKAAYALPPNETERQIFNKIAGNRQPPTKRVREVWIDAGRRGGKSEQAAAVAIHSALFVKHKLSRDETGMVLVIAGTRDQAKVVFGFIRDFLDVAPALRREVVNVTKEEITLRNGIVIAVHSNSFRTVRGRTLVAAVFDEVSFWRDEQSALPDLETYRAILPSLATTDGILIGISTPFRRMGKEWVQLAWRGTGIAYVQSMLAKSDIYLECIPLFSRGLVRLPDHPKLLRELRLLHLQRQPICSADKLRR